MKCSFCQRNIGCRCSCATSKGRHTMKPRGDCPGRWGRCEAGWPGRGTGCGLAWQDAGSACREGSSAWRWPHRRRRADLPAPLVKATVDAVTGRAAATASTALAANVLKGMLLSQLRLLILLIIVGGVLGGLSFALTGAQARKTEDLRQARDEPRASLQADGKNNPAPAGAVAEVVVRVVDKETKRPLPGVNLRVWINDKVTREHVTDDSGRFVVSLPKEQAESVTITAQRNGLVPMRVYLRHFAARETEIPQSDTIAMERGISIGGIVRDEAGGPVEGASVAVLDNNPGQGERAVYDFGAMTGRTDRLGHWHIDLIPAALDLGRLHFIFSHPEFLSWTDLGTSDQPSAAPKQLRSHSGVAVLRRGIAVTGRVLARDGSPIAGATVRVGEQGPGASKVATDALGRFRVGNAWAGENVLTAQAAGHAPEVQPLTIQPGLAPVELRLGPGNTIRGRVVDSQGRPVVGAIVGAFNWRGHHTLDWRAETDAEGRFRWDDAPSDSVLLTASKPGYSAPSAEMKASESEHVYTLRRGLLLRGTVVDAVTGTPIRSFTVIPGVKNVWMTFFAKTNHSGRYELAFDALGTDAHRIRIEAEDYRPAVSRYYENDAGEQVFDARLEKGEWLKGVVHGPDGAALAGAEVLVVTYPGVGIRDGKDYLRHYAPHVLTGADGRFTLPPPDGPFRLVALHGRGYAEATGKEVNESHGLTLGRWGRVEGRLRVGGKAISHETVVASLDGERIDLPGIQLDNESRAETNEQGQFVIERVVPGEVRIAWQPETRVAQRPDRYYQPLFRNRRLRPDRAGGPCAGGRASSGRQGRFGRSRARAARPAG